MSARIPFDISSPAALGYYPKPPGFSAISKLGWLRSGREVALQAGSGRLEGGEGGPPAYSQDTCRQNPVECGLFGEIYCLSPVPVCRVVFDADASPCQVGDSVDQLGRAVVQIRGRWEATESTMDDFRNIDA